MYNFYVCFKDVLDPLNGQILWRKGSLAAFGFLVKVDEDHWERIRFMTEDFDLREEESGG